MHEVLLSSAAIVIALAWIPFCLQFYRNWKRRRNPISMAIFALIVFVIFSSVGEVVWLVLLHETPTAVATTLTFMQGAVCAFFYFSFRQARAHFDDTRDG